MTDVSLDDVVLTRVSVADLPERVEALVLAAYQGDDALASVLGGQQGPDAVTPVAALDAAPEMFLRRITVAGFRGIGPPAVLELTPGSGLTVVSGRNGSGKSSFAEAAELVLTGENRRWSGKQHNKALWQGGWRNLETNDAVDISVELVTAGDDRPTTVRMTWSDGADLDGRQWTRQRHGVSRETVEGALWARDMELYRPFLSYDELGAVFDSSPSTLHDQLHRLLGLGPLDEARERLRQSRLLREKRATAHRTSTRGLRTELGDVDDDRARRAQALLSEATPDVDAIGLLAVHDDDTEETVRQRALLAITLPATRDVQAATERVVAALAHQADVVGRAAEPAMADTIATLLDQAITLHSQYGDQPCPVCGEGTLDPAWRERTRSRLARTRELAAEVRAARDAVAEAGQDLTGIITAVPNTLRESGDDGVVTIWEEWTALRGKPLGEAATAAVGVHARLTAALGDLQASAGKAIAEQDEQWRPVAARLLTWHTEATTVHRDAADLVALKKAEKWLKDQSAILRDERLAPITEQAGEIWRMMRQQSDVKLGTIQLTGTTTQRRVSLDVMVGETATSAYSVMSQGELHALALSLFLPRATMAESPFRFVVIDDPVQAMDPGKVWGLAEVLAKVARTRQVVVFSHDDRLAEAVRRLPDPPTQWEVSRRPGSTVAVVRNGDPVDRYLSDARALAATDEMPADLRGELVANCCRGALEAAAHQKVRRVRLSRGVPHEEVEAALSQAQKTHGKVTLAVFDDPSRSADLYRRLNQALGGWATDVLRDCKEGAHAGTRGDLHRLASDTERLARWLTT